ncbi:MAG: hypothetical protein GX090_00575 [Firmicutes bacterium]|nr:hypothetical protein [Bacillota bacterium]HOB34872.1 hypothetical protein [Bacillota bacterium]HPZ90384.1 hypothetical protein [Bacillota bacterium]HQE02482.1 hypothetical protein [Bacillota bacterium]
MKLLEEKVPVIARFDGVGVRPLEFIWRGRRWPVRNVIRTWRQFSLLEEQVQVFVVETGNRPAQLSYFPQSGWWRLDKI